MLRRLGLEGSGSVRTTGDGAWSVRPVGIVGVFVEPVTADFRTALRARLKGAPSLAGLTEVYWRDSPPSAVLPFLIFADLYATSMINTSDSYYAEEAHQFDVFGLDDEETETLGEAAFDLLYPRHENPPLLFAEGYEMTRLPGQGRGPAQEAGGAIGGRPVWKFSFDYTWFIGKD